MAALMTLSGLILNKILILGGYGSYGRLISAQLAQWQQAHVIVSGRSPKKGEAFARQHSLEFVACDAANASDLRQALRGVHLLINAAGPFQATDYRLPQLCLESGCHYLDLGDGREYVAGFRQLDNLAKANHLFACTGASTSPAITGAMVTALQNQFPHLHSIKIALNAGNKNQAGHSTVASILDYVGKPVPVWQDQSWQNSYGWGRGEFIDFPPPVGRRRVQLCDVPDLDLFPQVFAANSVEFKAGLELPLFNYALVALAQIRRLFKRADLAKLTNLLIQGSHLFKGFGSFHGCVAVWVQDDTGATRSLALVAPKDGPRVPAAPATLMAQKIVGDGWAEEGAYACLGFLSLTEIVEFLRPFGIFLVEGDAHSWTTST